MGQPYEYQKATQIPALLFDIHRKVFSLHIFQTTKVIQYFFRNQYDFMNSPGGICNGITSREADDKGLEFIMAPTAECDDNWRWAEQWLPHACWYLNAMGWKLKRVK